jgi:hypothetical protein
MQNEIYNIFIERLELWGWLYLHTPSPKLHHGNN